MKPDVITDPHALIQWKGTDVCLDFYCNCGAHGHVDAEFCYYVQCGKCGQVYEMSCRVEVKSIGAVPRGRCKPRLAEVHQDDL